MNPDQTGPDQIAPKSDLGPLCMQYILSEYKQMNKGNVSSPEAPNTTIRWPYFI